MKGQKHRVRRRRSHGRLNDSNAHKPLLDIGDTHLRKDRANLLDTSKEGGRITPYESSFFDDDLEDGASVAKKIDFDMPKFDKQVLHMLELDQNDDAQSKNE